MTMALSGGLGSPRLWTGSFLKFMSINLFIFLGFDILLPTLTLYLEGVGASHTEIGRIYSVFVISSIFMRTMSNRLAASRLSATILVMLGLAMCSLSAIAYYWATGVYLAMGVRFVQGAGFGLVTALTTALASQIIPPARMGEGMGYLGLGSTLALAIGPFFGVWLMEQCGFLVLFLVVAACYLGAMFMAWSVRRVKLPAPQPGSPKPKIVLLSRLIWPQSVLMFLLGLIFNTIIVYLALFCKERGLGHADTFFVLSTIGILASRLNTGRIYDHWGHRYIILPSGALLCFTVFLLYHTDSLKMLYTASILYGLATGALFPSIQALAMSAAPLERRTEAASSFLNAYDLGFGLGALIMGFVAGQAGRYGAVYLTATGVAVIFMAFYCLYYLRPGR
ncbi:MAG: MFS transporter [Candidatus Adiutrix sp.]|jgi:predicted MFS family arabinose efflux permease|nr:MFS transporter [Candidatus Adiutrix sp.]